MILHSTEKVTLIQVPGSWIPCQLIQPPPKANKENSITTYESIIPKKISFQNDLLCTIPSIPAVSPFVDTEILQKLQNQIELSAPLKGDKSMYSCTKALGYRSGSRSSIIPCRKVKSSDLLSPTDWVIGTDEANNTKYVVDFDKGTTFIRAKGCGMWLNNFRIAFPSIMIKKSHSIYAPKGKTVLEISGVSYLKTSLHEMSSTMIIEANLNKIGLFCANHSIGFWIYKKIECDSSPLFEKTVSIFETLGDCRLECHLLTGLERLLAKKYDDQFALKILNAIDPLFEGMIEKSPSKNCATFSKCFLLSSQSLNQSIINETLFNLNDFELNDFSDESIQKMGLIPTFRIYDRIKNIDRSFLNLAKLFGQIGFECGRYLSVIHRSGFIWGFFEDNDYGTIQCNSHCNNFVVLSKEQCLSNKKRLQILAPLDFDLSFHKNSTVNLNAKPPVPDPSYFLKTAFSEVNYMASDIGGFCATCEGSITAIKARKPPPGLLSNLLWLLRDCAAYEFYKGYQKVNADRCEGNDITVDEMYELIYEGLNETKNENS